MSNTYPDLENNFPDSIDNFDRFVDPDINSLPLINQYYIYLQQNNLEAALAILNNNPSLQRMIVNAYNMNMLRDGLISVERYYLDDVQQYLVNIVQWKGEWQSTITYTKYNVVVYQVGNTDQWYMGIETEIPMGTLPTNTNYWVPLALKGEKGDAGEDGEDGVGLVFKGQYNYATEYVANDAVEYQGSLYGALQTTQGNPPTAGGTNAYWSLAWSYQIPNHSVTYDMLATSLQEILNDLDIMTDQTTGDEYRWGVDNGMVFIEEV